MALSAEDVMFEPGVAAGKESELAQEGEVGVVLVSFLRDWAFWRGEGTRAVGTAFVCSVSSVTEIAVNHDQKLSTYQDDIVDRMRP